MTRSVPFAVDLATLQWGHPAAGAPRALLLHGLPSAAATWWQVASLLAEEGWAVTAADLRGHGLSPRTTSYALDGYAADVARLHPPVSDDTGGPAATDDAGSPADTDDAGSPADADAGGRTHMAPDPGPHEHEQWDLVIGHSLGAAVSVVAAASHPRWARALLLLDPVLAVAADDADGLVADLLGDLDDLDPLQLLQKHPRWHLEDAVQKVAAARVVSPFVVERTVQDNVGSATSAADAPGWQLEHTLAGLRPRVHVLAADPLQGATFSQEQAARLTAAKADATVVTVAGAGHSVHRDDPHAVVAAALDLV